MFYNNGDIYEGDFHKNKREGQGVIFRNNKEIFRGEFKNDEPVNFDIEIIDINNEEEINTDNKFIKLIEEENKSRNKSN